MFSKNERKKKGSKESSMESVEYQFKCKRFRGENDNFIITIIISTRPHMFRCCIHCSVILVATRFRVIYRVQKHAHRLLRISTSYNRFENCLRLSTPRKTSSRAFFPLQDCSKFKSRKRWKKKKDRFDRFSRIECVYIHRSQIQFGHRPNTNCPNEAAYYRVLASSGNLIMMPTFNYEALAHILTAVTY